MNTIRATLFSLFYAGLILSVICAVFFFTKIRERERFLDDLIDSSIGKGDTLPAEERALALSREIFDRTNNALQKNELDWYSRWESTTFFNVTSGVALRYGGFGVEGHSTYGACGTMSRILLNALWKLDVPARKLQLLDNDEGQGGGHTMVEFLSDGRWLVISPSDGSFVWRKANGEIATADEIKNDERVFSKIFARHANYPYRFDNYGNIRWEKLPPRVVDAIRTVIGEKRFNNAKTPKLYDKPRTLFFVASLIALCLFFMLGHLSRPLPRSAGGKRLS
ncbi:MAG: hypothetical protein JSW58_02625 [Candidatus Latescibacterota bacterium]|nr:MAG: hypothetical protein JSW58_02625 [Candidatus Latescibacterota bacterium]